MSEVICRRFTGSLKDKLAKPDLLLIDGGLPQVNAVEKALCAAGIDNLPLIGLAKKNEELYFPGRGRPLQLSKDGPALKLLMEIRDEAHRFALKYHRLLRSKAVNL